MARNQSTGVANEIYYQISDDDMDECEDMGDDSLLEEVDGPYNTIGSRGPYERAWTTDATRALIHIRGPMEGRFTEGRQKRTALWLQCTRQLHKLGYKYSAAKVQKKWHNILITYNKNLSKKYMSGYVHWEFFEDMFKYLQGKKADFDIKQKMQKHPQIMKPEFDEVHSPDSEVQINTNRSNDEFNEDSTTISELKQPKLEFNSDQSVEMPLQILHEDNVFMQIPPNEMQNEFTGLPNAGTDVPWWKAYFERKLQTDREKIQLQRDMHRELMQFNKMSLVQQEKIERLKIDAINTLTGTLQKLMEAKKKQA